MNKTAPLPPFALAIILMLTAFMPSSATAAQSEECAGKAVGGFDIEEALPPGDTGPAVVVPRADTFVGNGATGGDAGADLFPLLGRNESINSPVADAASDGNGIVVTWAYSCSADMYRVYRTHGGSDAWLQIANYPGGSYGSLRNHVAPGELYCYQVSAMHGDHESERSQATCAEAI